MNTWISVLSVLFLSQQLGVAELLSAESRNLTPTVVKWEKPNWSVDGPNPLLTLWQGNDEFVCLTAAVVTQGDPKTVLYSSVPSQIRMGVAMQRSESVVQTTPTVALGLKDVKSGQEHRNAETKGLAIGLFVGIILAIIVARIKKSWVFWVLFGCPIIGLFIASESAKGHKLYELYIDNATTNGYRLVVNGQTLELPSKHNLCVFLKRQAHGIQLLEETGRSLPLTLDMTIPSDTTDSLVYILNLARANQYAVYSAVYQSTK